MRLLLIKLFNSLLIIDVVTAVPCLTAHATDGQVLQQHRQPFQQRLRTHQQCPQRQGHGVLHEAVAGGNYYDY